MPVELYVVFQFANVYPDLVHPKLLAVGNVKVDLLEEAVTRPGELPEVSGYIGKNEIVLLLTLGVEESVYVNLNRGYVFGPMVNSLMDYT